MDQHNSVGQNLGTNAPGLYEGSERNLDLQCRRYQTIGMLYFQARLILNCSENRLQDHGFS